MDHIETEPIDLVRDKNYIDKYFSLAIKRELKIEINVSNEYIAAQNIVSRKFILVKTFSEVVMGNPELYFLLTSLIHDVNTRLLTKGQIIRALEK
ncbi:hypothetical protein [Chryseobacterium sp.]|jgi:hypothetical protein|uniref:hypothetical protein n=1 Tax=Chryseobacterium sp. TaxID=1871047 RepID=UPI0028467BBE|nr:hypothetical protein [Chryseobacterium sp.]MDR3025554.1 hypothetical protein [Chryseobacterium sp.]